jgi:hypothetical protein
MRQRQQADPRRRRICWFLAAGVYLLGLVWQHVEATRLGYRVEGARQHILALQCSNGAARMQLETILSPANLSAQARGRLGMTLASPQSLRSLDETAAAGARITLLQRLISRTRRVLGHDAPRISRNGRPDRSPALAVA